MKKAKPQSSLKNPSQPSYDPSLIEKKWQKYWEDNKVFSPDMGATTKPFYNLMMFPYPSAEGMHVGNMYAFTGADVYGRFMRMQGYDVFEPIGLDGFGIHSENYAFKTGRHPMEQAEVSEKNFYRQLRATGNSYDWTRTVETYKPNYYHWTQWLFIQLFKAGLAYRKKAEVNWCPSCKTVLADEQVIDARCERCGSVVERRQLEQWFFRITEYAERLLNNIEKLDWTEKVKIAQRNWIGKSEGARIDFKIVLDSSGLTPDSLEQYSSIEVEKYVEVFTTRPDTLYGATFLVLSPEHHLAQTIEDSKVRRYIAEAKKKDDKTRTAEDKEKTGVFTGLYAINPVTKESIPVWIADYVLMGYGTGAIMGVPAHDQRDFKFARKYNLPIRPVVLPQRVYVDNNAKSYYEKRTKLHRQVLADLLKIAFENNKKLLIWGGWAVAIQLGKQFRENEDLDLFILEEDVNWWKERLKEQEFDIVNMFPEGKNEKYYFQAIKQDVHIDFITLRVKKSGRFEWLSQEKPYEDKYTLEEVFEQKEFEGFPIWVMTQKMLYTHKGEVAEKKGLPMRWNEYADFVMMGLEPYVGEGKIINSNDWNGWEYPKDIGRVVDWLEQKGIGKRKVQYHLRDWLISRQRYWGPPIPMIYCQKCADEGKSWFTDNKVARVPQVPRVSREEKNKARGTRDTLDTRDTSWSLGWYPVPDKELPVALPRIDDYKPLGSGTSPLGAHPEFYTTKCPSCGSEARRETDVSDTFLDSSWYFFRYVSTDIESEAFDLERVKKWLPVDMYIGGAEHSVLHLLYSRFITMVLADLKYISFEEPYKRFFAHGLLVKEGAKMSKSKGNVVIPDEYIKKFGADTVRCYLMFLGPFNDGGDFYDTGIEGMHRFLKRVWRLFAGPVSNFLSTPVKQASSFSGGELRSASAQRAVYTERSRSVGHPSIAATRMMHKTIKKVTEDIQGLRYNTAIAALMEWLNYLSGKGKAESVKLTTVEAETFLKLLAPFAPHMTEELWERVSRVAQVPRVSRAFVHPHPRFHAPSPLEGEGRGEGTRDTFQSIHTRPWPTFDPKLLVEEVVKIIVQVNGKVRDIIEMKNEKVKMKNEVEEFARKSEKVQKYLEGKNVKYLIYVEGKIINFVVK